MNPFSMQPGNRKNAMTLITILVGVGVTILWQAMSWPSNSMWIPLGFLGLTQGTHAMGNIAAKRSRPGLDVLVAGSIDDPAVLKPAEPGPSLISAGAERE